MILHFDFSNSCFPDLFPTCSGERSTLHQAGVEGPGDQAYFDGVGKSLIPVSFQGIEVVGFSAASRLQVAWLGRYGVIDNLSAFQFDKVVGLPGIRKTDSAILLLGFHLAQGRRLPIGQPHPHAIRQLAGFVHAGIRGVKTEAPFSG